MRNIAVNQSHDIQDSSFLVVVDVEIQFREKKNNLRLGESKVSQVHKKTCNKITRQENQTVIFGKY